MKHALRHMLAIAPAVLLFGCTGNQASLENITPSMDTLAQTYTDTDVDLSVTDNKNLRMAQEDLGRVWYTNRPSRLTPYPVVNTTGNPQ